MININQHDLLHRIITRNAINNPDQVAIKFRDSRLTYRELDLASERLALHLRRFVKEDHALIAICLERGFYPIIAILGIHKAGHAYVPIEPNYPNEYVKHILHDADINVVITEHKYVPKLQNSNQKPSPIEFVMIESLYVEPAPRLNHARMLGSHNDLAYVIYTSGSTGKPKGIKVKQYSLSNIVCEMVSCFSITRRDITLMVTPLIFDLSVSDIFIPLVAGSTLVIADEEQRGSGHLLKKLISTSNISFMQATPGTWQLLLDANWVGSDRLVALTGGEAISQQLATNLVKKVKRLWNMYGPAEATVWATYGEITSTSENITIGKPFGGVNVYILNEQDKLTQDAGVTGELCISGIGLADGYLNREELTTERFTCLEDTDGNVIRVYKTGDTACFLENYELVYIGRRDQQLKVRGFRVEPGAIESHLLKNPLVEQCAVIAMSVVSDQNDLVAAVVSSQLVSSDEIRSYLMPLLPQHMIPNLIYQVDSMPLTMNGKIDKEKLKCSLQERQSNKRKKNVAPCNSIERQMLKIWESTFNSAQMDIGIADSFFSLGGHSLLAAGITNSIREQFSIDISIDVFYKNPTIRQIAKIIANSPMMHTTRRSSLKGEFYEVSRYPLSNEQFGMLLAESHKPDEAIYNLSFLLKIKGKLDIRIFERSVQKIVERHSILRTTFNKNSDGKFEQVIQQQNICCFKLEMKDLTQKSLSGWKIIHAESLRKFNLESWPLFKITAIKTKSTQILAFCFHHLIIDGYSLQLFLDEVSSLYNAYIINNNASCSMTPSDYYDYALWQKSHHYTENDIEYWKKQLANFEYLGLSHDCSQDHGKNFGTKHIKMLIDKKVVRQAKQCARNNEATLYTVLVGAFNMLLSRACDQNDISIGCPSSVSRYSSSNSMLGPRGNLLLLRTNIHDTSTFDDLVRNQMRVIADAIAHEAVPFDKLVEIANQPSHTERHPLTPLLFIQLPNDYGQFSAPNITTTFKFIHFSSSVFDMVVFFHEQAGAIKFHVEYNPERFKKRTVNTLFEYYLKFLERLLVTPNASMRQLLNDVLGESCLRGETSPVSMHATLHDSFRIQTEKTPDVVAISHLDKTITYRELEIHSNQLARCLKDKGINNEFVLVCLERNIDTYSLIIALLKTGNIYAPVDIVNPVERISDIALQSKANYIIVGKQFKKDFHAHFQDKCTSIKLITLDELLVNISNNNVFKEEGSFSAKYNYIAYSIHTSGTTGKPKGCLINHKTIINLIQYQRTQYRDKNHQNVSQFASLGFDVSMQEIFYALLNGLTLHITPEPARKNLTALADFICQREINLLTLPTALLSIFSEKMLQRNDVTPHLTDVVVSGEKLHVDDNIRSFFSTYTHVSLSNQYGPAETHVVSTYMMPKNIDRWTSVPPIGKPIDNVSLYVLNKKYQQVPRGSIGELYIAGPFLSSGYHRLPLLTADKFIDPVNRESGQLYKTGDRVKISSDNELLFVDRLDNQIKLNGHRIELEEVEHYILQCSGVDQCYLAIEQANTSYLIAFIIKNPYEKNATQENIKKFVTRKIPHYMMPQKFIFVTTFPLNSSGKVDKKMLLEMSYSLTYEHTEESIHSNSEIHEKIHQIICGILNIKKIHSAKNIFDEGVNSIVAMKILLELESMFSVPLPPNLLYENPSIMLLSNAIDNLVSIEHI